MSKRYNLFVATSRRLYS